jgi:hypothetical protein
MFGFKHRVFGICTNVKISIVYFIKPVVRLRKQKVILLTDAWWSVFLSRDLTSALFFSTDICLCIKIVTFHNEFQNPSSGFSFLNFIILGLM